MKKCAFVPKTEFVTRFVLTLSALFAPAPVLAVGPTANPVPSVLFVNESLPKGGIQLNFDAGDKTASSLGKNLSYALGSEAPGTLKVSSTGLLTGTFGKTATGTLTYSVTVTDTDSNKTYSTSFFVVVATSDTVVLQPGTTKVTLLSGASGSIVVQLPAGAATPSIGSMDLTPWGFPTPSFSPNTYTFKTTNATANSAAPNFQERISYQDSSGVAQTAILDVTVASSGGLTLTPLVAQAADQIAQTAGTSIAPAIVDQLTAGSNSFHITGTSGSSVSVYAFDSSFELPLVASASCAPPPTPTPLQNCQSAITSQCDPVVQARHLLTLAQSGTSTTGTQTSAPLSASAGATGPQIYTITMAQPLAANTTLCLAESTPGSGNSNSTIYSANPLTVIDTGIYGRFQALLTGGAIISNQIQASASTTAAAYLDALFSAELMRAQRNGGNFAIGITGFADGQLSSVPVSTKSTTTTTGSTPTGSSATVLTQSLNALSSQSSVRVIMGLYAPVLATKWFRRTNRITIAPIAHAGFDTLLNPTSSSQSAGSASTGAPANITTNDFSQVYDFWSGGLRMAWEEYRPATDYAARTDSYFTLTVGNFSNLPSYVCKPGASFETVTTKPTWTTCFTSTTSGGTTSYTITASRHLIPRIEATGFLRVPNTSFVLGMDANLGQYSFGPIVNKVDPLSKPGNDVRFYVGYQLNLSSALNKLGIQ